MSLFRWQAAALVGVFSIALGAASAGLASLADAIEGRQP